MKNILYISILIILLCSTANTQIFYNIEMPASYQKNDLIRLENLSAIEFDVDINGNLSESNISTELKDYFQIESIGIKKVARVKFSINAFTLGEITLRFSNVFLNNDAYCYVYTKDFHIVAGPIYKNSINEVINIVKIPARELILEVVYNDEKDFNIVLKSIVYQSIIEVHKKSHTILQSSGNNALWGCNPSENKTTIDYYNNSLTCDWVAGEQYELFQNNYMTGVNDKQLEAVRAACIIMRPERELYG